MNNNIIFTFSGSAGAGKDTCAYMLADICKKVDLNPFMLAYADSLKMDCIRNFGFGNKSDDRHILQDFGSKIREIEKDFWVRQVFHKVDAFHALFDVFIISDCRHENELKPYPYVLAYPIINVYVKRDFDTILSSAEYNHESESMGNNPDLSKFHYVIDNNGSLEDTHKQLVDMFIEVLEMQNQFLAQQRKLFDEILDEDVDLE